MRGAFVAVLALLLFAPGALADHTAGGGPGGSLLPDLKTKEPERFSISQAGRLYMIDPSPVGFPSVGGSHQTWSRSPNLVTGDLVYDVTSLGTKRGCADAGGTSPWTGTPHTGKIVLMDRGDCAVSLKVHNAAAAGAVAAVIANNVLQAAGDAPPNFTSGGGSRADDIAAYTITLRDGNKLKGLPETTAANTNPSSPNALNAPATIDPAIFTGELRLLLDNEVGNTHTGPLELWSAGADSDCDGDGSVTDGERIAFQRHYQDGSANDGRFVRGQDTSYTDVQVGCFAYHPAHGHTHFGSFATYELRRLLNNALVSSSEKVTFCIADIFRVLGSLPGSPAGAYYTDCGALSQGLSVGWSDEYPYTVAGQHIVLNPGGTYVGDGTYCVVSIADPSSILAEDNNAGTAEANNAASVQITLSGNGSSVQTSSGTSCGGVGPESWSNPPAPPPADTTAPARPSALTAAAGDKQIALDWANNTESDLAGYRVYRKTGVDPATAVATTTASSYTDSGLTNGTTYTYYVTAYDTASPSNESGASSEVSATPGPAALTKSYQPAGYTLVSGSVYFGQGSVTRLYSNNGSRVEITAASGSPRVAEIQPYASITVGELATLRKLTVDFDGGVSSSNANLILAVCKRNADDSCAWETVKTWSPAGTTADRAHTWSTSTSPAQYVSSTGEIRFSVKGTRSTSFRTRTDWVRFTIDY